ncbi:HNH endonuclease [Eubacterium xylanophilum]|uniref:HNH endonuclease n=1 Tax=Eubacterium xylanophilum TaxID=39497 RepID=UPI0004AE5E95|nr:HNH endonuclease [Eubacterium xylanophilum]
MEVFTLHEMSEIAKSSVNDKMAFEKRLEVLDLPMYLSESEFNAQSDLGSKKVDTENDFEYRLKNLDEPLHCDNDKSFHNEMKDEKISNIENGFEERLRALDEPLEFNNDENMHLGDNDVNQVENVDDLLEENKEVEKKENDYKSEYEERINQTPKENSERGEWDGPRGESKFIPSDPEIKALLGKYGLDGIDYKDAIPDFSKVSESTVEINNMTSNRAENFKQCDEQCAEQWNKEGRDGKNDWTARDVAQWRKENGYSWHERNDMKTCDLIPQKINDYFGHLGGVSECRKCEQMTDGGDFDE